MSPSSFPAHNDHAHSHGNPSKSSSGLTFVLPPLSAVKAQKAKKKLKPSYEEPVKPKIPRPLKLKPLKEVLTKLITQIKKKDDYAFFLQPVDPAQVPGYTDVISRPMDLGTMTTKVEKGKYRSLEEFASDLRLVTTNAKTFNPPGTIYYTEAERIEQYALEHIAKAAATVIEYETDWNIEIVKDEDPVNVNVDDDDASNPVGTPVDKTAATPMDVDESRAGSPFPGQTGGGKRTKGKKPPGPLSESLEPDGGLPGVKDGLGAFPPGSDWAELMLALKLKGKRYRTKKERMRIEKSGPPLTAEGSLDYSAMEDPFSVLSFFVPDPPSRPQLDPLFPTLPPSDPSKPTLPAPVNIMPTEDVVQPASLSASTSAPKQSGRTKPAKRRHWTIVRNASTRGRAKDAVDEEPTPAWKTPREPLAADFGTFAVLPSILAAERRVTDVGSELGSEEKLFEAVRQSVEIPVASSSRSAEVKMEANEDLYWEGRAAEAEAYIRDVVYGGVDGFAYVRSLAEFLTPSEPIQRDGEPPTYEELGMPVARWVEENIVDPLTDGRHAILREAARILSELPPTPPPDPASPPTSIPAPTTSPSDPIRHQIELSLRTYPAAARALALLQSILRGQIDLPALIRTPDELFRAEDVWAGREYREKKKREMDEALARDPGKNAAAYLQWAIEEHREAEAGAGPAAAAAVVEDEGMLEYALQYAADEIARLARERAEPKIDGGRAEGADEKAKVDVEGDVVMKTEEDDAPSASSPAPAPSAPAPPDASPSGALDGGTTSPEALAAGSSTSEDDPHEDPELRKLRLNLLALAKRAPLDQIMRLPPELVPAHLRHIVPTADS
ncbi:hypothetical protein PYCCODRAFT_1479750 [Trametes coccinea BRFM310]|uniref:Bromo domain-containing protein n=1 Tax=Trametes coccinea (strain BRFM310) TaxID=1353009 RepID=A0A1Y2IEU2_TRAC3|nr:hypothetical protein PYCCODRAFT_1479750 [Trametes coccinea BRFM310]